MSGRQPALHVGIHPRRGHGHDADLPLGRLDVSHPREKLRQVRPLQLFRPAMGQVMVEVLPCAAKGCFSAAPRPQPLGMLPLDRCEQLLVKLVAIIGDLRTKVGNLTVESWALGRLPLIPEPINIVPPRPPLPRTELPCTKVVPLLQPMPDGLQRRLLNDEPPRAAGVVQSVHVPLAEEIIGTPVHRMVEIVRPRIQGQFVELIQRNHGVEEYRRLGLPSISRPLRPAPIRPDGRPRAADVQRDRPDPFLDIRFDFLLRLQDRHGPISE